MSKSGATWNFTYDADGLRSKLTDGSNTYLYYYDGGLLRCMEYNGVKMFFTYDAQGMPVSMTYNGATYYYALNLQGDVMAILNASSAAVVNYNYNAWGELLSTTGSLANTIGLYNPLRYRGYVYDRETGLYYLQSRYYNPELGRFINADGLVSTGQGLLGNNMFAYCGNNPANRNDPTGCCWSAITDFVKSVAKTVQKAVLYISMELLAYNHDDYLNEKQMRLNATLIYKYLSLEGWSHNAICAMLGNMQQESNINPGMNQRGGPAYGLVQWDPATKYTDWAQQNGYAKNSMRGQLNYLTYSMQPNQWEWFRWEDYPYLPSNEFITSNLGVDYLTAVVFYGYERVFDHTLGIRIQYALQWSEYFG